MYKVELSLTAAKELGKICRADKRIYRRILNGLEDLALHPLSGKALVGSLKGCYSYRVGLYRILYIIRHERLLVSVIDIGHRSGIYR